MTTDCLNLFLAISLLEREARTGAARGGSWCTMVWLGCDYRAIGARQATLSPWFNSKCCQVKIKIAQAPMLDFTLLSQDKRRHPVTNLTAEGHSSGYDDSESVSAPRPPGSNDTTV